MEPSDLNTHLPPRKRLLAGLRTAAAASPCDAARLEAAPEPPLLLPDGLAARLRAMPPASTQQEIIQAAQRAADAAADAAAAARAAAVDKAAVAARARAAARAAMEFLDSLCIAGASRNGIQLLKPKSKKKHVQVKLLYRPPSSNGRAIEGAEDAVGGDVTPRPHRRRRESDEEVARKLHRVMNSSPRISFTGPKRPRGIADGKDGFHSDGGGGDACNGSSTHTPTEVGFVNGGSSVGKSGERTIHSSKIRAPGDDGEEYPWNTAKSSRHIVNNGDGIGNLSAGRKVKIKRKQLFLNHHSNGEQREEHKQETEQSRDPPTGYCNELKSNGAEKRPGFADDARAAAPGGGDDPAPTKITSVWKFKKFKPASSSHCSSDSKMLCSSSSAAETSASVKAD
ncbi:uncharacterized protein LOC119325744 [Triticum dicoccoides]|uniref:Uncharacterized protein n=1 Tax=Triticum turgidum subsp. durum TaxID=4567 RepID=A0A9R0YY68_TRITD|nr:uncharacterized protein LOC119325744 [Triticum dicoccoides]VAI63849.1 unnamed protein product [Triticum turgidum subsp. durum]